MVIRCGMILVTRIIFIRYIFLHSFTPFGTQRRLPGKVCPNVYSIIFFTYSIFINFNCCVYRARDDTLWVVGTLTTLLWFLLEVNSLISQLLNASLMIELDMFLRWNLLELRDITRFLLGYKKQFPNQIVYRKFDGKYLHNKYLNSTRPT